MSQQHVIMFDAARTGLPFAMREQYLADYRAWVVACCRTAAARDRRPRAKAALALLDSFGDDGSALDFSRWASIGPHGSLRRELDLSQTAVGVLLLAVAPKLWAAIGDVYALLGWSRATFDTPLFAALLGGTPTEAVAVALELAPDATLRRAAVLCARHDGVLQVAPHVVERIAFGR